MKKKEISPAQRLIVAADFRPDRSKGQGRDWVRSRVLNLSDTLAGIDINLKMNSALRACGYGLIHEVHERGIRVMADLKLNDIPETLAVDGALLCEAKPELLTVMCDTGAPAIRKLKAELPGTEILGVTVLTSKTEADAQATYKCTVREAVVRLAWEGVEVCDGLVSSAAEVPLLRQKIRVIGGNHFTLNTPAIRPSWAIVPGDDQNQERIMTPAKAIAAGADRIIVGRPIVNDPNPREATLRTIDEIIDAIISVA
jgi:orotidine-5'-phosphate decarboxylase